MKLAITDIKILSNQGVVPPQGYEKIPVDLNQGAGGYWLWLAYTRDVTQQASQYWITALNVIGKNDPLPSGWIKDPTDLNGGTDRNPIYLIYKKGGNEPPVTDIQIKESTTNLPAGYKSIDRDLNQGVGGAYLYLIYLQSTVEWVNKPIGNEKSSSYSFLARVNGQPAIAYVEKDRNRLKYARYNDPDWQIYVVVDKIEDIQNLYWPVLAEVNGQPAISYIDNGRLKYARYDGSTWQIADLDEAIPKSICSLAEVNGQPAIAYIHSSPKEDGVKYTRFDGTKWEASIVESFPFDPDSHARFNHAPWQVSLLVVNKQPAIIYATSKHKDNQPDPDATSWEMVHGVTHAQFDGTKWKLNAITDITAPADDPTATLNYDSPLQCAVINGQPAVCYSNFYGNVPISTASHAGAEIGCFWFDGTTQHNDRLVVERRLWKKYISLAEINGQPAVTYVILGGGDDVHQLHYQFHDGTGWQTQSDIANSVKQSVYCPSMVEVNGQPVIGYMDSGGTLYFLTRRYV